MWADDIKNFTLNLESFFHVDPALPLERALFVFPGKRLFQNRMVVDFSNERTRPCGKDSLHIRMTPAGIHVCVPVCHCERNVYVGVFEVQVFDENAS
jgi:hypothetical protein